MTPDEQARAMHQLHLEAIRSVMQQAPLETLLAVFLLDPGNPNAEQTVARLNENGNGSASLRPGRVEVIATPREFAERVVGEPIASRLRDTPIHQTPLVVLPPGGSVVVLRVGRPAAGQA